MEFTEGAKLTLVKLQMPLAAATTNGCHLSGHTVFAAVSLESSVGPCPECITCIYISYRLQPSLCLSLLDAYLQLVSTDVSRRLSSLENQQK